MYPKHQKATALFRDGHMHFLVQNGHRQLGPLPRFLCFTGLKSYPATQNMLPHRSPEAKLLIVHLTSWSFERRTW